MFENARIFRRHCHEKNHSFVSHGIELSCTLSIGVADFDPHRRKTPDDLVEATDKCLYQAKRNGRNRIGTLPRLISEDTRPLTIST